MGDSIKDANNFATSLGGYNTGGIDGPGLNDISNSTVLDAYTAISDLYDGDAGTNTVSQAMLSDYLASLPNAQGNMGALGDNSLAMGMAQSQQNPGAAIPGYGLGSLNPSGGFTIPTGPLGQLVTKGQDALNAVASKVGDAIDEVFRILRLPNPTKIIGAPKQKKGTIVWGQTGGSPLINTGTTGAGTKTGITTGNVALDAVLNKMTGVLTGKISADQAISLPTLKEILIATTAEETGLSTEKIEEIIESAQTVADATLNVAQDGVDPNKVGIDLTGGPDVGGDTTDVLGGDADVGDDGAAPELKATADAVDVVTNPVDVVTNPVDVVTNPVDVVTNPVDVVGGAADVVDVVGGAADVVDVVTNPVDVVTNPVDVVDVAVPELKAVTDVAPELKAVTGPMSDAELDDILGLDGLPAVEGGYDTPAAGPKGDIRGGDIRGGDGVVPEQIIGQGGMESISTEKAGLAEINALYNPALSLAENMALLRGSRVEEEDIVDSAIYYGGGMIQNTDMTDEINRLLRGY